MSSKISMTDEQLFLIALAYETSKSDLSLDEFIQNVHHRHEEAKTTYKSLRNFKSHVGNKSKLGI